MEKFIAYKKQDLLRLIRKGKKSTLLYSKEDHLLSDGCAIFRTDLALQDGKPALTLLHSEVYPASTDSFAIRNGFVGPPVNFLQEIWDPDVDPSLECFMTDLHFRGNTILRYEGREPGLIFLDPKYLDVLSGTAADGITMYATGPIGPVHFFKSNERIAVILPIRNHDLPFTLTFNNKED